MCECDHPTLAPEDLFLHHTETGNIVVLEVGRGCGSIDDTCDLFARAVHKTDAGKMGECHWYLMVPLLP